MAQKVFHYLEACMSWLTDLTDRQTDRQTRWYSQSRWRFDIVTVTHGLPRFLWATVRTVCILTAGGPGARRTGPTALAAGCGWIPQLMCFLLALPGACWTLLASLLADWHVHVLFIITRGRSCVHRQPSTDGDRPATGLILFSASHCHC